MSDELNLNDLENNLSELEKLEDKDVEVKKKEKKDHKIEKDDVFYRIKLTYNNYSKEETDENGKNYD